MPSRPPNSRLFEGKVQHHGRFAFLIFDQPAVEDMFLKGPSLRLAMDGDRVTARLMGGTEKGRPAGEIVSVLERARTTVTGVLRKVQGEWMAVPEETDERDAIKVVSCAAGLEESEGAVVVVHITQWPTLKEQAGGEVREVLGLPGDPRVRLQAVLRTRDIPEKFPGAVLAESQAFPREVSPAMWAGRLDLRELALFTIDGEDAKDFDDAVSLEVTNPDTMRLGVHIADVSHYVKPGTALDEEAAARATSVYMADRVVPMLPPNLSDHLCSLMPDVERLTLSCFMEIDAKGQVLSSTIKESVIRSCRRFTYEDVETILKGGTVPKVTTRVHETVLRMGTLARQLTLMRMRRGALDMTMPEYKVRVDAEGRPIDVVKRDRLGSHRLIEEFMLLANETVARALLKAGIPFLSRVHPDPDPRKLALLGDALKKIGVFVPTSMASAPSKALQIILAKAVGQPLEDTINMQVVRSLKQASYDAAAGTHFGLASQAYCHFTSPIRRYPDLITHRALRALMGSGRMDGAKLKELGVHCSERERLAADAERRSVDILRAELLKKRVGEVFDGIVSGSAGFGLFVTLSDLGASGLVRGATAALGSKVKVKLDRVDEGKGELDMSFTGPGAPSAAAAPVDYSKPRFDPNPRSRFDPKKPRFEDKKGGKPDRKGKFNPATGRVEKPRFEKPYDPSKPKWEKRPYDPSKPKFEKRPYDPSKPKFEKRPYDPSKPKFEKRPYDPSKSKFEKKFDDKSKSNPNSKPAFYDQFRKDKKFPPKKHFRP